MCRIKVDARQWDVQMTQRTLRVNVHCKCNLVKLLSTCLSTSKQPSSELASEPHRPGFQCMWASHGSSLLHHGYWYWFQMDLLLVFSFPNLAHIKSSHFYILTSESDLKYEFSVRGNSPVAEFSHRPRRWTNLRHSYQRKCAPESLSVV